MPLISEQVHPLSLDFENQRKVVIRRSHFKEAWSTIAGKVKNLAGDSPSDKLVARVYKTFSKKAGRRRYKYKRCGRRPWKLTKPIQQWLIRTLRNARRSSICTSTTLQQKLAKVKGIQVEASAILMQRMSEACFSWAWPCPYLRLFAIIQRGLSLACGN